MRVPMESRKLGRLPSIRDPRTLRLARYLSPAFPAPPESADWTKNAGDWPVMGNDDWGDCVFATKGHLIQAWSAAKSGNPTIIPDQDVIDLYRHYSPRDVGFNILDSLKLWRSVGFWSHKIWAFAEVSADHAAIKAAIHLFGGVEFGVNLPIAWNGADVWDVGSGSRYRPGSWGGHSVPAVKYDSQGVYVVTWGDLLLCTWAALDRYIDEFYCMISPDWLAPGGTAPNGFDLPALHADLQEVTG